MSEPVNDDQLEDRLKGYLQRFTSYPRPRASAADAVVPKTLNRRRRLGLFAALTAAALCVTGTAAAALVVTLRGGVNGVIGSSARSGERAIFVPFAGPGAGTGSGQGAAPAAAGPIAAGPAALPAQGASSYLSQGGPSIYPGNYLSCAGGGSTQVANGQIQVQSIATVGSADQTANEQLTIQVSGSGATNKQAVTDAQAREVAVDQALQGSGITSASITIDPVQIGQNGYFYYNPNQTSTPAATGTITVTSSDPVQLGVAADAAKKAGGSQVSSYSSYGTQFNSPSSGDIATALSDATATAHDEAAAAASASGLHLGRVSGITTTPPSLCYGGGGERLVVTVTINYSVAS